MQRPAPPAPARAPAFEARSEDGLHASSHARSSLLRSHVILPKHIAKTAPKGRLLTDTEWRGIGVQQSRGWVHYSIHRCPPPAGSPLPCAMRHLVARSEPGAASPPLPCRMSHPTARSEPALAPAAARPEPHILLFRRPIGTDPTTGLVAGKRIDPNTGKVMP